MKLHKIQTRTVSFLGRATLLLIMTFSQPVLAQDTVGVTFGPDGVSLFASAIERYYHVPQRDVIVIRERGIPIEEIPVVYTIARHAHVQPITIVSLRLGGRSWADILRVYQISPEIFYVPVVVERLGPPYGKAYGYYKKRPKKEWKYIVLEDDDVINLVNLRFITESYKRPPTEVITLRTKGDPFVKIHQSVFQRSRGSGKHVVIAEPGVKNSATVVLSEKEGMKPGKGKSHRKNHGKGKK